MLLYESGFIALRTGTEALSTQTQVFPCGLAICSHETAVSGNLNQNHLKTPAGVKIFLETPVAMFLPHDNNF